LANFGANLNGCRSVLLLLLERDLEPVLEPSPSSVVTLVRLVDAERRPLETARCRLASSDCSNAPGRQWPKLALRLCGALKAVPTAPMLTSGVTGADS